MLKGDSNPWRDVGEHACWYDPYAALEDPNSKEFRDAVKEESARFITASHKVAATEWTRAFSQFYEAAIPVSKSQADEILYGAVIQHRPGHRMNVWLAADGDEPTFTGLSDFGIQPDIGLMFTITDVGKGAQYNELAVFEAGGKKALWRKAPVGPTAAFQGDRIYYTTVEKALRSNGIESVDARTGKDRRAVYHNTDGRFQVELFAPRAQPDLFVRITNALSQRIGLLDAEAVKWLSPAIPNNANGAGETQIPLTRDVYATNSGLFISGKHVPFPKDHFLESASPAFGADSFLVVVVHNGCPTLLLFRKEQTAVLEMKEPAEITLHTYSSDAMPTFELSTPTTPKKIYEVNFAGKAILKRANPRPLTMKMYSYGRVGKNEIPYTLVAATMRPRKLLVEAYGSYGISAHRGYPTHWLPWLARGYAIAVAMPRGGREKGDAWYEAARTALRKKTTFEDVAIIIKHIQRRWKFTAGQTVIYGRSAGGWTAAYIGLQHPDCVGAVYAEVPYLDVLRTTTNPALPLTILEYDEFGNPIERPDEFAALQTLSPVDLAVRATPGRPFFLLRTALHDAQVLPYEALKFAARLRERPGTQVIVGIDRDGGHFAAEDAWAVQLGTDAALIDAHLHGLRRWRRQTRRVTRSQTAKGTCSRRTKSRKHRTRHSTSPATV